MQRIRRFGAAILAASLAATVACASPAPKGSAKPVLNPTRPPVAVARSTEPAHEVVSCRPVPSTSPRKGTHPDPYDPIGFVAAAEAAITRDYDLVHNYSAKDLWFEMSCVMPGTDGEIKLVWGGWVKPGRDAVIPKIYLDRMTVTGHFMGRVTNLDHYQGQAEDIPIYLNAVDNFGWAVSCGPHC